jgi:4-diphosphocytidyl-2-C-methyl-D-erythritol kinase
MTLSEIDRTGSTIFEPAPAKINLALHVVGQRADGYHLLESIVTFAQAGDELAFRRAGEDSLSLSGRFAGQLSGDDKPNLVLTARDRLRSAIMAAGGSAAPVAIHLEKNLPIAAGIGGGSADCAATLRGLLRFWNGSLPDSELVALALSLGADVPMCLNGEPLMVRGIGEDLTPLPSLPKLALVLGNPLVGVSTPEIFRCLTRKENPGIDDRSGDWLAHLESLRNDLEPPARSLVPDIAELALMIEEEGALLTRMSGSGATCFGIFSSSEAAQKAAENLTRRRPDWYFQATETVAGHAP